MHVHIVGLFAPQIWTCLGFIFFLVFHYFSTIITSE